MLLQSARAKWGVANLERCNERRGLFAVACSKAAPPPSPSEGILDQEFPLVQTSLGRSLSSSLMTSPLHGPASS